ncbi:hypothetical protein SMF913_13030 [Streptomyces malaysiensis]|uniref:Uncharacterized protein n=1 Tax=Streptomyces malaysiensis TaxID=92644 RepID=A0A2J7Z9S1_STRMQ|nr:hypothetical protein SMF913_13030 [Streptomyces malaysiensis]
MDVRRGASCAELVEDAATEQCTDLYAERAGDQHETAPNSAELGAATASFLRSITVGADGFEPPTSAL